MKILLLSLILSFSVICSCLYAELIENGGFETGDLTGWNTSGNGSIQVLSSTDISPLVPPEGTYFTLIGNGPSDVLNDGLPDSGTLISNPFIVTQDGTLKITWNFLTAEFTGTSATTLDFFTISLTPSTGIPIIWEEGNVSLTTFSYIDGGSPVTAPDGSSFIEHINFQTSYINIIPETYTLTLSVGDDIDGTFDSGLLIDRIEFTPVPEPNHLTILFGILMFYILILTKKRISKQGN